MNSTWKTLIAATAATVFAQNASARLNDKYTPERPEDVLTTLEFAASITDAKCTFSRWSSGPRYEISADVIRVPSAPVPELPGVKLNKMDMLWAIDGEEGAPPIYLVERAAGGALVTRPHLSDLRQFIVDERAASLRYFGAFQRDLCPPKSLQWQQRLMINSR